MKKTKLFMGSILVVVFTLSVGLPSWGCDAMGPNRHVGLVTKIDPQAGTFTIIDAQLVKPLTFNAEKKILDIVKVNGSFIITFRMDGTQMKAESAIPQSEGDNA